MTSGGHDLTDSTSIWVTEDPERFATFRDRTQTATLEPGQGLPGAAAEAGRPTLLTDRVVDTRSDPTDDEGDDVIRSGLALPVMTGPDVVAVLEFLSDEESGPTNAQLLALMSAIGTQLGRAVERRRADEARFRTVVDHMPALDDDRTADAVFNKADAG